MRRRRWRLRGTVVTTTVVALSLSGAVPGAADPPADTPAASPTVASPSPTGTTTEVTLLTGDVVQYTVDRQGKRRVALDPASNPDRLGVSYLQIPEGDSYYVYPSDAMPLIESGRLDRTLFDVAYLVENGFGDAATDQLPVIAQYGASVRSAGALAARTDALPASSDVTALESVHGAGFEVAKDQAGQFWSTVTGSSAKSRTGATTLGSGLTKLWMDRLVTPTLDQSTGQIGAPAAWESGLDGAGTKVAVLDTGIDLDHPDFAGRVLAAENFTTNATVHDGFGHGTHVASIVAGSGAASGGKYRGVAPGASLMIGKVLGDYGTGSSTDVIEGMEWAAANGADVVNMSLGSGRSDGTDLQSQVVNALTARYGTLFVVAAGNSGPGPQTVGSPSAADAALSVAAVDRDDQMASFSSRGPRFRDFGLKPDIAGPGVAITAARSEPSIMGGDPGARYMSASGTSMAAPHVAGAAAILSQKNPKWTASELKPVLVSTAKDAGHRSYEQGAGRVDITRALNQQVYATNNLDFGKLAHPQSAPVTRTVSYVNRGDEPVTLNLTASLSTKDGSAPTGMLRIDRDTVTVPANGTAEVAVTVDPTLGELTWYEGALRASADGIEVGSAIGLYKEPETFEVTGKLVLPDGAPQDSVQAFHFTRDDGRLDRIMSVTGDRATETKVQLNAGPHTATVLVGWMSEDGFNSAIGLVPEFEVRGDTTVTVDLRRLRKVEVETPHDSETYTSGFGVLRLGAGQVGGVQASASARPSEGWHGWLLPTDQVRIGTLDVVSQHVLGAKPITMSVAGRHGARLHGRYQAPDRLTVPRLDGRRTMPLVDGGTGTAADLAGVNARGALVLLDLSEFCEQTLCTDGTVAPVAEAAKAGAAAVLAYGPRGHVLIGIDDFPTLAIPTMSIPTDEARMLLSQLNRGPVRIDTNGTAMSPYQYQLAFPEKGRIPRDLSYEVSQRQVHRIDHRFHADAPSTVTQHTTGMFADLAIAMTLDTSPRRSQSTLTEYIGPVSDGLLWSRTAYYEYDESVNNSTIGPSYGTMNVFDKPGRMTESWNSRPRVTAPSNETKEINSHPWVTPGCGTCRVGDTMVMDTPALDADGHQTGDIRKREEFKLTRDGQQFALKVRGYLVNALFFLFRVPVKTFDVPASPGTYRQEQTILGGSYPQMRYSVSEKTAYTFRSQRPNKTDFAACLGINALGRAEPCAADKILRLRYDTEVDLTNRARAGASQRIDVSGYYGNGLASPKLRSLRLWASADDGKTWQEVRLRERDGKFSGEVKHPALSKTTGAITLRAKATDVNGSAIEQTIDRAYGLR